MSRLASTHWPGSSPPTLLFTLVQVTVVFMGLFMIFFILTVPPLRKELVRDLSANWFR